MELKKSELDRILDKVDRGELSTEDGNVAMVRARRVHLVTGRIPASVRRALNAAVKRGELGHVKKDGGKPEAYFHPTFKYLVAGERNEHERAGLRALAKVCA